MRAERRIVSVLMADVADSTRIGERLGPERSKFLFDEVVRLIATEVERLDGTVAQLAGDGLLALFGAPVAHEDDPERAVRAGRAVQRVLAGYAAEVRAAYGVDLGVRLAVNTGAVVVNDEERDGERRYNALGDTVNVAARLQQAAPPGEVVAGPATARQLRDRFELEPLGPLELRGRSAPVEAHLVRAERDAVDSPADRPLVGREFELTVVERAFDGLVEGRGVIVSITGEPGIGKSRLVAELCRRYRDRVRFVEGRAVSYAQSFAYWPVRDLLREWLGVGVATPDARVRLELKAALAEALGDGADDAYPFVARLLGLALEPGSGERYAELNRESIQQETFQVIRELLCRLADDLPLCLVLDDLHWADDATLDLVERLLSLTEDAAVAFVLLHRSERDHRSWQLCERARQRLPHRYREVELATLPADASRELAAAAADGELPGPVAELVAERAGGNPFFLEEAVCDLIERGALRRSDGRWELAVDPDELAVPALLENMLQARLDRLDPAAQETLSLAAVIGRTFAMPLLDRLLPHERVVESLTELQRLGLVLEHRRRPFPEYRFRHGLVQEVAYARLLESRRRELHRRVGEGLEQLADGRDDELAPVLARHFSEADEVGRAIDYLLAAGDAARAMYADREAVAHYRHARRFLARVDDSARSRETLFKIALTHHLAFDFAAAEAAYDEAFSCRVEPWTGPVPTETLATAMHVGRGGPRSITPGDVYTTEGQAITNLLFRGLLHVDRDLNVVPAVADNFRVSADGLVYLFQLHAAARWSDGVPVTADDFVYAWDRTRDLGRPTSFLLDDIDSATALDDRTLEVRMKQPRSYYPYVFAMPATYAWPRHVYERLGDAWREPERLVGNGPFQIAAYDDHGLRLEANPAWVGPRGNLRTVTVSFVRSIDAELEEWAHGRYDLLATTVPAPERLPDTRSRVVAGLSTMALGFDAQQGPFRSRLVRKAFAHAVDVEAVVAAQASLARPAAGGGVIPPAIPGHDARAGLRYDPELARSLLAEAGFAGGRGLPPIRLRSRQAFDPEPLVAAFAGLGARVEVLPPRDEVPGGPEAHAWVLTWVADFPDPDGLFRGLIQGGMLPLHRDDEIDELLRSARSVQDRDARMELYHRVDRLWVSDRVALLPLAYARQELLWRPWIEDAPWLPLTLFQLDGVRKRPRAGEVEPGGDAAAALPRYASTGQ